MPERNRAAIHVHLVAIESQLLLNGEVLRREGFVHFDQIDVLQLQPGFLQRGLGRRNRSRAHDLGIDAGYSQLTIRAIGFRLRFPASSSGIITTAAPPSTIPLALPAVTLPFLPNAGFSLARLSMVVSGRRRSSSANISPVGSPLRLRSGTGVNSSWSRPAL